MSNWKQFNTALSEAFNKLGFGGVWSVEEDNDGQIIIYTGLRDEGDSIVPFEGE